MQEDTNLKLGQKRVAYAREQHHRNQERDDRLGRHREEGSVHSADGPNAVDSGLRADKGMPLLVKKK